MTRKLYDGFSITELRRYASEYGIAGRSKMDGTALMRACRAVWDGERIASERECLSGGPISAGTLLVNRHCPCLIVAMSGVMELSGLTVEDTKPLYVHGQYVSFCDAHKAQHPASLAHYNEAARGDRTGEPYRFMIYQLRHAPAPTPAGPERISADCLMSLRTLPMAGYETFDTHSGSHHHASHADRRN